MNSVPGSDPGTESYWRAFLTNMGDKTPMRGDMLILTNNANSFWYGTTALISRGKNAPGSQLLTYWPQILWGVRIWTPFRDPIPERRVIGGGVLTNMG